MFEINGTLITVIKGDTGEFDLKLSNYSFVEGDVVYMTVKKDLKDSKYVMQKVITNFKDNIATIKLNYEDTAIPEGKYIYDIQCSLVDGRVDTVISPSIFIVLGGVTDDR